MLPTIVIVGTCEEFTITLTTLLLAVIGDAHGSSLVSCTLTSAFVVGLIVSVAEFDPAFAPFTIHWYCGFDPPLKESGILGKVL